MVTDKEKINKAWKAIEILIDNYEHDLDKLVMSNQFAVLENMYIEKRLMVKDLEKIKIILRKKL